jgi:hypothetical protein
MQHLKFSEKLTHSLKMKPKWWPGEEHEAFTEWAFSNGVDTNNVTPARFPGRGLGMMATQKINV